MRYLFAHFEVLPGERKVLGKLVAVIKKKTKTRIALADWLKYIDWVLVLWGDPCKKHFQACTCPRMSLSPGAYNVTSYIYMYIFNDININILAYIYIYMLYIYTCYDI